ncbi:UNVERIFIED_CONTAM: hypothetical protein FKN15_021797 [Acipenser sinensis]
MKSLICVTVLGFIAQVYALPIRNELSGAKNMDLEPWVVMDKIIQANANIAPVTRHYSIKFGDIAVSNSRTAMFCPPNDCFWPRSDDGFVYIPYKISTEYSPSEKAVITDAMSEYAKVSCIRFVSYMNEMDYLHVQPLDGCWSYFGRSGGEQPISFSQIGCLYKGIIIHELMHTLGFYHEHNRSDREEYITIMVDNIQPDCGGLLESSSGEIFSPNYPNLYPNNKDCQWRISATSRVELIFQSLDVEYSVNCLWDYIEVHDGPSIDSRTVGPRLCGSYTPKPLTSSGKDLLIMFHSDENMASKGFHISYT